jgi:hypothetical protein
MTKPSMTSQWDPRNFKPLDMSKISGYPRQIPPKYKNWLPRLTGSDGETVDYHMVDFLAFFQLHPIGDDVEDLEMKLFSATLHGNARKWYDNLPNANITSMKQLEETFLKRWGIKLEDTPILLKRLKHIKQTENETIRQFQDRFEDLLFQIPRSHHHENKYILYLYTNALLVHLRFPLSKKGPRIEANISLSQERHLFTLDTLSLERLVSFETFTVDFQEEGEQIINQQEAKHKDFDEVFQSHKEEQRITHSSAENNEDVVEELEPEDIKHDDEVLMCPPPSDEAIQSPIFPAQEEEDEVSHFPFQDFDNTLFHDSKSEGEMESSGKVDPPCCTIEDVGASHEDETLMHIVSFDEVVEIM